MDQRLTCDLVISAVGSVAALAALVAAALARSAGVLPLFVLMFCVAAWGAWGSPKLLPPRLSVAVARIGVYLLLWQGVLLGLVRSLA